MYVNLLSLRNLERLSSYILCGFFKQTIIYSPLRNRNESTLEPAQNEYWCFLTVNTAGLCVES